MKWLLNLFRGDSEDVNEELSEELKNAIVSYNDGVKSYRNGSFARAERHFAKVINTLQGTLPIRMAAAYARTLCQNKLGKVIIVPLDLEDKTDEVGSVYLAYTTAGILISDGHKAVINKKRPSSVDADIGGVHYVFFYSSLMGRFSIWARRTVSGKSLFVWEALEEPNPRDDDKYAMDIVNRVKDGTPDPVEIPLNGIPNKL